MQPDRVLSSALAATVAGSSLFAPFAIPEAVAAVHYKQNMDPQTAAGAEHEQPAPTLTAPWVAVCRDRIAELGNLPDGWGGSEKPSPEALAVSLSLVEMMAKHGHRPLRIAPIADGGIAIRYVEGGRPCRFDVYNDGGIVVVSRASREATVDYVEMSERDAVAALATFIQGDDAASAG